MQQLPFSDLEDVLQDCGVDPAIHEHTIVEAFTDDIDDNSPPDSLYSESPCDVISPAKGGTELAGILRRQLELRGQVVSRDCHYSDNTSLANDNEEAGKRDNIPSMLLFQGFVSGLLSVQMERWKAHWNWNDFFYNLILDLAPASWDIITDLIFAGALEIVDIHSAGLSYMFICLPFVWLVSEHVAEIKINKIKMMCYIMAFPIIGITTMCCLWADPLLFKPLAILFSIMFLGLKFVAVFEHSPEMAQFSLHLSQVETATEGPLQLLLILHVWLSGGLLHWDTLLSSLLDIGKVGAEKFLTAGPKDLLKGKTFLEKLVLVLKYLPVFLLTALFRVGAGAVNIINYSQGFFYPFSTAFAMLLTWVFVVLQNSICQVWFALLRVHLLPGLQQLDYIELGHGVGSESTGISVWGGLGRRGSRAPQMVMATWFLLHNLVYMSIVLESTFTQVGIVGLVFWAAESMGI